MSDVKLEITLEDGPSKGRYVARAEGHDEPGELTFSHAGAAQIIVDHTGVPDSLRGLGVGVALTERVVADARAKGLTIIPLCPFFKAQAEKRPEWDDVVRGIVR